MFPPGCVPIERTYRYKKFMVAKKCVRDEATLAHQIESNSWLDKPEYVIVNTIRMDMEIFDLALICYSTPRRPGRIRQSLKFDVICGYEKNIHIGIEYIRTAGDMGGHALEIGDVPRTRGDSIKKTYNEAKEAIAMGDTSKVSPALVNHLNRVKSIPRKTFSSMAKKRKTIHDYTTGRLPLREHQAQRGETGKFKRPTFGRKDIFDYM